MKRSSACVDEGRRKEISVCRRGKRKEGDKRRREKPLGYFCSDRSQEQVGKAVRILLADRLQKHICLASDAEQLVANLGKLL